MRRPSRRIVCKMSLLLIAGMAINVALAWGLAIGLGCVIDAQNAPLRTGDTAMGHIEQITEARFGSSWTLWRSTWLSDPGRQFKSEGALDLPHWFPRHPMPPEFLEGSGFHHQIWAAAYGWPFRSLYWSRYFDSRDRRWTVHQGIQTGEFVRGGGQMEPWPRVLPLGPLWPGFAVNTLFYAGVSWVLFCGPFALRRMIRRRRGQCPQCAYPIGTSEVCTECGAEVQPRGNASRSG